MFVAVAPGVVLHCGLADGAPKARYRLPVGWHTGGIGSGDSALVVGVLPVFDGEVAAGAGVERQRDVAHRVDVGY